MVLLKSPIKELPLISRGKVRDVHDAGDSLLIVTTDRISAFDVVLPNGIPKKGEVLNRLSAFWFRKLGSIIQNHLVSLEPNDFPSTVRRYRDELSGRSMLVKKAKPLPIEAVVRGYLVGSGWNDYQQTGAVCGISLPKGLVEAQKLTAPIFTPATKALQGTHDENISFATMASTIGTESASEIQRTSIELYRTAETMAREKGILIADTKFEFGIYGGTLMLIDEALTPDSSRFWPMAAYQPGICPPSFDKQYVRDYLVSIKWNKQAPGPELPADVVKKTSEKYCEALRLLTGEQI